MGLTLILALNQVSSGLPESILVSGHRAQASPRGRPCLFLNKPPLFHAQLDVSWPPREGATMSSTMIQGPTKKKEKTQQQQKPSALSVVCWVFHIQKQLQTCPSPGLEQKFLQTAGDVTWKLSEEKLVAVCKFHFLSLSG